MNNLGLNKHRQISKPVKVHIFIILFLWAFLFSSCHKEKVLEQKQTDSIASEISIEQVKVMYLLNDYFKIDSMLSHKVNSVFKTLNDTERVAQMIMTSTGNNGKPFETVYKLAQKKKIGGVIIMGGTKYSFKAITGKLDSVVKKNNYLPLFFSADAEPRFVGSRIQGAQKFDAQSNTKLTKDVDTIANKIAMILKDLGLNMNFAPVCDISINKDIVGDRSFGNDPKKIVEYSKVFIIATQKNNIIATAKHFPGHGNVKGDSHKEVVFIDGKLTELETFTEIINSGVIAVMIGHIAVKNNPEYNTDGVPSSLSKKIITDLLRKKLGFKGLIVTDALNMGAVTKFDKPALNAAIAGCDILLMPTDEEKLITAILIEMSKNPDFKSQVYDSVKRIIRAKICLGLFK